jgi:hypothetical protein
MKAIASILLAGLVVVSVASCSSEGHCDAYQGSGKGTRSFKSHKSHRHASVIRTDRMNKA